MASRSKKIFILHDFNLKLELYNLKSDYKKKIINNLKNKIVFISSNNKKLLIKNYEKITVFWGNRLNKELLDKLINLKWVHFGSSGINYELKDILQKRKIQTTRSNKLLSEPVVSSIFSLIFFLGRGLMPILSKKFYDRKDFEINFNDLSNIFDEKIVIFGKGEIAKKLKKKLTLIGTKVFIIQQKNRNKIIRNKTYLSNINNSKFIINCLPLTKQNINFFDKNIFKHFNKCYFINIGRGETVNDNDLIYYIKKNFVAGAALDVFNRDDYISPYRPLRFKSKLWKNKKILITPHISARSRTYWELQTKLFIKLFKIKQKKLFF